MVVMAIKQTWGLGMNPIENATGHFSGLQLKKIEVPEWGNDEGPLIIYSKPMTLEERNRIHKKSKVDAVSVLAEVLIMKALDKDGHKLFTIEHKRDLKHRVDPDVISKIANEIMGVASPAEMEKN